MSYNDRMKCILIFTAITFSLSGSFAYADSKAVAGAKEDIQEFKQSVKQSLDKIDQDIDLLKEKAKDKGSEVKQQTVEEAKLARAKIDNQLTALKDKSKEGWSKTKQEISSSVDSLSKKIQDALK